MQKELNHKIQDFLNGKLIGKDLEDFQNELRNNQNLLNDLSEEIIKQYGREQLKEKLDLLYQEVSIDKNNNLAFIYRMAASIILISGLTVLVYIMFFSDRSDQNIIVLTDSLNINQHENIPHEKNIIKKVQPVLKKNQEKSLSNDHIKKDGQELYISYLEPFNEPEQNEKNDKLENALNLYSNKHYKKAADAITLILPTLQSDKLINKANFFKAVSIMLTEADSVDMADAIKLLDSNYSKKDSQYKEESGWYMALLYLYFNDIEKAKKILSRIETYKFYNYKQASLLLDEL